MTDLSVLVLVAGAATSLRTLRLILRTALHAKLARTPAEFVMMEKAAAPKPFKVKAHKTAPPIPYGL